MMKRVCPGNAKPETLLIMSVATNPLPVYLPIKLVSFNITVYLRFSQVSFTGLLHLVCAVLALSSISAII